MFTQKFYFADDRANTEFSHISLHQPLRKMSADSSDKMLYDDVMTPPQERRTSTTTAAQRPWETIQKRQADRQKLKQERCHANGSWPDLNTQDIDTMMVDTKHQAAFCAVAKTASTSWTTKLLQITGNGNVDKDHHVPFIRSNKSELTYIKNFSPKQGQRIIASYYTFTFVREPWERLLSCWYSTVKPKKRKHFYIDEGRVDLLSKFSKKQSDQFVPFQEFLDYITTSKDRLARANKHWRPIYLVSIWWRHDKTGHRWISDSQNKLLNKQSIFVSEYIKMSYR